jgi:hypothetical protein
VISKKLVLTLSLCVAGSLAPAYGSACVSGATLATYEALGSAGCDIGAYNFSLFQWIPTGSNPHSTPTDTQTTLTTLLNSNGTGFLIGGWTPDPTNTQPAGSFSAGGGGVADGELSFVVKVIGGGSAITSIYNQIDGTVLGTHSFADVSENYAANCTVTYSACAGQVVPGPESRIGPGGTCINGTSDGAGGCDTTLSFSAVASISVRKDIRADASAGDPGAGVALTGAINQFGPAVPEPGTYVLSFIGLGLMFLGTKKFSRS